MYYYERIDVAGRTHDFPDKWFVSFKKFSPGFNIILEERILLKCWQSEDKASQIHRNFYAKFIAG